MINKSIIPLCVPCLSGNEKHYVVEALDSNWVSYVGPHVNQFEEKLVVSSGAEFAVAMNSGTSALHIALILAGVFPNDEVVMPALTFVSPANAVRYCGAWPVFVDICESDWQMSVEATREFFTYGCDVTSSGLINKITRRPVKAILVVHLLGGMGDVDAFAKLADEFGLFLIEDGAECFGARYKNKKMASFNKYISPHRRLITTSFNGNKIVTTGGGGALFLHDEELTKNARHLSTTAKVDKIEFFHDKIGYNYRLSNLSAALGLGQIELLEDYVNRKRAIANEYVSGLKDVDTIAQFHPESSYCRSIYWMYTILLNQPALPIVKNLEKKRIITRPLWRPMSELPAMKGSFVWGNLITTRKCCTFAISLPCSVNISKSDQDLVMQCLKQSLVTL